MARILSIDGHEPRALHDGWELAEAPLGLADPAAIAGAGLRWRPAIVPGTAAAALAAAGEWDLERERDFDAADYWYRCRFSGPASEPGVGHFLRFDGLATIAEAWLNGAPLLRAENMFLAQRVDVTGRLAADNELVIAFRALRPRLDQRRPRPRWRPRLIAHQQLRWFRTTLLGRMPGWCPKVAPVGPWRPVRLEERRGFDLDDVELHTAVDGRAGLVRVRVAAPALPGGAPPARIVLGCAGQETPLRADGAAFTGELRVPDVALWWPHTHGAQPLYPVDLIVDGRRHALGKVGFRTIELDTQGDGFALRVNGVPVFCRGAVWTTPDVVRLGTSEDGYRRALGLATGAGMNMLRVGGTMAYEDPLFHTLCDELGVLVWQELMFANMDYPAEDAAFVASVRAEVRGLLGRLQGSPSLALVCGNSEIEQQAAMLGLPRETWRSPLFGEVIPQVVADARPDVPYWPSSPAGGTLPFQVSRGLGHYYGVGAYLRPLEDARRAEVRFAAESLAFANVPEPATVEALLGTGQAPHHHPRWKARVPRDPGVGWDFEDVRDHYVQRLYGVDPAALRYADPDRYLALGRVVTGEVMAACFAEWRRAASPCGGALVWTFQDVWPGAGWGVVDAHGRPKAAYHFLKRALAPFALGLTDEGVNGLLAHAVNDTPAPVVAALDVVFLRHGREVVAHAATTVQLPPRSSIPIHVDGLLEGFRDTTYAYRFGPPGHEVVAATLTDRDGRLPPSRALYYPTGAPARLDPGLALEATLRPAGPDALELVVRANAFAYAVAIEAAGWLPDDNHFSVVPGQDRVITLRPLVAGAPRPRDVRLAALNGVAPIRATTA